jgi:chromosome segregation ATPase
LKTALESTDSKKTSSSSLKELEEMKSYIEELKKLEISKDVKINELNHKLENKEKELLKVYQENENLKNVSSSTNRNENENKSDELKIENNRLSNKVNDLELKMYKFVEESKSLNLDKSKLLEEIHGLKEKLSSFEKKEQENQSTSTIIKNADLDKLMKDCEEEKFQKELLERERIEQEGKIANMKNAIQEIKDKFEFELVRKEKIMNEKHSTKEEEFNNLNKKLKTFEIQIKQLKSAYQAVTKEKMELEEILIKQEEKVNELGLKVNKVDKLLKDKNRELKENEESAMQLVKIIEEQKKTISNLYEKSNPVLHSNKRSNEKKTVPLNNNLKKQPQYNNTNINKDDTLILPNINLPNKSHHHTQKPSSQQSKRYENVITENDHNLINELNDIEEHDNDEKLNEITNMMKKILAEN